jgi:hypothetical protein
MDKPARSLSRGPQEWSCRAIEPLATVGLRCWCCWRQVLTRQRAVAQLQALGYRVTLEPLAA